jgi:hypothetical protein
VTKTERFFYSVFSVVALLGMPVGIVAGLVVSPLATGLTALGALLYGCFLAWGLRIRRRMDVGIYRDAFIEEHRRREADLAREAFEQTSL